MNVTAAAAAASSARQRLHTRLLCWGTLGSLKATRPTEVYLEGLPPREDGAAWDFVSVGAGLKHFALVTSQGDIVLLGNNRHGQVGQPASEVMLTETMPFAYDVGYSPEERPDTVVCGCNFNILYRRGMRHATVIGYNVYGQLGLGHKVVLDNSHGFAEWDPAAPWWEGDEVIADVSCGKNHTFVTTSTGRVLGFGSNQWGELGLGHNTSPMAPTVVQHFTRYNAHPAPAPHTPEGSCAIKAVRGGNAFSLFLAKSGHVFGCGSHEFGQLPFRSWSPKLLQLQREGTDALLRCAAMGCCADFAAFVTPKSEVFIRGGIPELGKLDGMNRLRQMEVPATFAHAKLNRIQHVVCGSTTAFFVAEDGQVAGMGSNAEGQLQVSEGRINTAPAAFMTGLRQVLPAPSDSTRLAAIEWRRHFAVGHGCALLLDPAEAYDGVKNVPMVLPPPDPTASGKRRVKF